MEASRRHKPADLEFVCQDSYHVPISLNHKSRLAALLHASGAERSKTPHEIHQTMATVGVSSPIINLFAASLRLQGLVVRAADGKSTSFPTPNPAAQIQTRWSKCP